MRIRILLTIVACAFVFGCTSITTTEDGKVQVDPVKMQADLVKVAQLRDTYCASDKPIDVTKAAFAMLKTQYPWFPLDSICDKKLDNIQGILEFYLKK